MKLTVVVGGNPIEMRVGARRTIGEVIGDARRKTGHLGNDGDWEARTPDGALLESQLATKAAGLKDGSKVYVNPRAGVGGATGRAA